VKGRIHFHGLEKQYPRRVTPNAAGGCHCAAQLQPVCVVDTVKSTPVRQRNRSNQAAEGSSDFE
jgi:hypothetical protein